MLNLQGKWALVTGASRGIGRLICLEMASHGVNLILHSRNTTHTQPLEAELSALGVQCYSIAADLASAPSVQQMIDTIAQKGTAVDILFNDAGVQIAYRTEFWQTPAEDFITSFQINTTAPAILCLHFIPQMIARGFGRVINTTSGIQGQPQQLAYSASKAALDKFTTDIASSLEGTGVLVNLADPGWCRTDMGGPHAPNDPESSIPGMCVGAFVDDGKSGRIFHAQAFAGLSLEEAVRKAQRL